MQRIGPRALMAIVALLALRAYADVREPWRTTVRSSRLGLPAVEVELGYRGPYVPAMNTPITLRATGAGVPFEGFIGYHFSVQGLFPTLKDRRTRDTAVIAHAHIAPGAQWSFSTIANLHKWGTERDSVAGSVPREVMIEWRDRYMQVVAVESAGIPPWTMFNEQLRPLVVIPPAEPMADAMAFGNTAAVERADALPDRAQWYRGFSNVAVPLATWLDLPRRVREAIFGSGVYVVLVGLPRPGQRIDDLDAALLPVKFTEANGSYVAPWPYQHARSTPMSWTAKAGLGFIGQPFCPYLVRSGAAAWGADEIALTQPLPAMEPIARRPGRWLGPYDISMVRGVTRVFRAAIASIVALGACAIAWIVMRRRPRLSVTAAFALIAVGVFVQRDQLRPRSAVIEQEVRGALAPGVAMQFRQQLVYGPAPLAARTADAQVRTTVTGDFEGRAGTEVRTSDTLPSTGWTDFGRDWDGILVWAYTHELDRSSGPVTNVLLSVMNDFHGSMYFWEVPRRADRDFAIDCTLMKQPDGSVSCAFAVDPARLGDRQTATVRLGNFAQEAALSWATGSLRLTAANNPASVWQSFVIPPAVMRDAAAHGGILNLTVSRLQSLPHATYRARLEVQEKKS